LCWMGEHFNLLPLPVRERLHLGTLAGQRADGLALPQQRDGQICPVAKAERSLAAVRKLVGACLKIMDVDRRTIDEGSSNNDAASDRPVRFHRNRAMMRSEMQRFAVTQKNSRIVRLAESRCRLSKRIEHDLQIERRPADDLEHIGSGSLLL